MPAGYQDLFLEQGTTFTTTITLDDVDGVPYDLTGMAAKGQIRRSYYSANATATFIVNIPTPSEGGIILNLAANTTANIAAGRYVYDVEIVSNVETLRVLEGIITVTPEATR